ncbi:RNA-directed DNA polymerase, eukaryota [Tanacetum coccineum]|uniref:RNA-directed DNA polymerase, eukaryota n=1 Tax=Tanacetum coccineum TaxID=301880 RepID=A0ABQ5GHU5_9ASTR
MENISAMDVKSLWGNSIFEHLFSDAIVDIQLGGYLLTWSHPSASKMSKLDRFLMTEGLILLFPHISAICLDRHLSDHRPILLRDVIADYGATPFRFYHSWFCLSGFEHMVTHTWISIVLDDRNGMVRFKKKLQALKKEIRVWVIDQKRNQSGRLNDIKIKLCDIDKQLDQGDVNDDILLSRMDLMKQMQDIKSSDARDSLQKAKIQWAIEGDENSKFFHGIINRKRANLSIRGVMVDGEWVDDPNRVKDEFRSHFATRFQAPIVNRSRLNFMFLKRLDPDLAVELEKPITRDEIRNAVWACGENKSPGPDGFTFEFFRKFWDTIGPDLCVVVEWFFEHCLFARGCNSSFLSLILKFPDPKFVNDYRPISLIGSLYKVPKAVLSSMESIRMNFFNGIQGNEKKITWVKWSKVLAAKKHGGLGVSSFYALNRALLFKWKLSPFTSSTWNTIIQEVSVLKSQGVDLISHCKKRVGNGVLTRFWSDVWLGDKQLRLLFPRIFALEANKDCTVATKLQGSVDLSLHRHVRGGVESHQLDQLQELVESTILTNSEDRCYVMASDVVRLFVVGGIWFGRLLVHTLNGCLGSIMSDWVQKLKYVDDAMAEIRQTLAAMNNTITSIQTNQVVNHGTGSQANQFGRLAKVEYPKFQGDDVKRWVFRCE